MITISEELLESFKKAKVSMINERGREIPSPFSKVHVSELSRAETMTQKIQRLIRGALSHQVSLQGEETFEQAMDFGPDNEPEPVSKYEIMEDEFPVEIRVKKRPEKGKEPEKGKKEASSDTKNPEKPVDETTDS